MHVIKPPAPLMLTQTSVFLAGSIDMGMAEPWQSRVEAALSDMDITIWNPRRDDWDSSWKQSLDNSKFVEQVEWELKAQECADIILMYFSPTSQAPITLLELGLFADDGTLIVCCPEGYWRKGNVDVVCRRYNIPTASTLEGLIEMGRDKISELAYASDDR